MSGQFITIEGQDGAGKSTNLAIIQNCLEKAGIEYVLTREPGGTELGENLRELLLNDKDQIIGDMAELLMIFAARAQHLQETIEPGLQAGRWIVCDRFTEATYAYQGGGREIPLTQIQTLEQLVQKNRRPDLTILLDLPEELGASRAQSRSNPDRFETQHREFKQRVRQSYLDQAKRFPKRIMVVDASASLDEVNQQVKTLIDEHILNHG